MIILDSNVLSELMKTAPERNVIEWLDRQASESICTTSITVFEIAFGIETLPSGRRQKSIRSAFEETLSNELAGRILNFDQNSAIKSAEISSSLNRQGKGIDIRDVQIAGIVASREAILATRNTKHFTNTGIHLVDPWG